MNASNYTTTRDDEGMNWDNKSETSRDGHSASFDSPPDEHSKPAQESLAHKETKRIWIWKQLVIALIIATAALVSVGTYKFLKDEEDNDFHDSVRLAILFENGVFWTCRHTKCLLLPLFTHHSTISL